MELILGCNLQRCQVFTCWFHTFDRTVRNYTDYLSRYLHIEIYVLDLGVSLVSGSGF